MATSISVRIKAYFALIHTQMGISMYHQIRVEDSWMAVLSGAEAT
jgi:hypothetical protein